MYQTRSAVTVLYCFVKCLGAAASKKAVVVLDCRDNTKDDDNTKDNSKNDDIGKDNDAVNKDDDAANQGDDAVNKGDDAESVASVSSHDSLEEMNAAELRDHVTKRLMEVHPVNIQGKAPSLDVVRDLFKIYKNVPACDDKWRRETPRTIATRLAYYK